MTGRIHDWVSHQAKARPDRTAIVDGDRTVTYAELDVLSDRLALLLREHGCKKGDRVVLLLPKGALAIAAMLGTSKAGAIYVPLDPDDPPARAGMILERAEPRIILVGPGVDGALPPHSRAGAGGGARGAAVGWLDPRDAFEDAAEASSSSRLPEGFSPTFTFREAPNLDAGPVVCEIGSDDTAYLLFTSGSTGVPKGVAITHDNVVRFVEWARRHFGVKAGDRLSGHAPLTFDLSTFDIYVSFAAGAELHPVPRELNVLPHRLVRFIKDRRLTHWFSVPSVLEYVSHFDALPENGLPDLRTLAWCGDTCSVPHLRYWMERLPHVVFTNLYGPTETTVASTYHDLSHPPAADVTEIPIGRACEGEEVFVLDPELRPVPPGGEGAIYIRGDGVGQGYWRDEETTAKAFLPDPFSDRPGARIYRTGDRGVALPDGTLRFLGREDDQIKTRGYRVELGEVEAAVQALPEVGLCACVAVEADGFQGREIACAYVPATSDPPPVRRLRSRLGERIPNHMVPTRWRAVEELPSTPNGKIDRTGVRNLFDVPPRADSMAQGAGDGSARGGETRCG